MAGRHPPIPGDAEHLYQAILNLVANALDAMEEAAARLTVRLRWPQDGDGFGGPPTTGSCWR